MVAKRGRTNSGKHSYPYVKKLFNPQRGRITIDPAIFAAIGHRFIYINKKTNIAEARVWGDPSGDQKPDT